jgi:protein RecA
MASSKEIAKGLEGIIGLNDEEATVRRFLDSGFPPLNHALSGQWDGGFPVGRVVEISGPPSAGKTAISTRVMAAAQKAGGIAAFFDHERSFSLKLAPLLGLDISPGRFIYKKPETLEESFALMVRAATFIRENKLIAADAPIAWVFDSLAAMVPRALLYDSKGKPRDPTERNMKDNLALATAASQQLPIVAQKAEDLGICVMILNQLRTKPGVMYGDPIYTPGGDAKEFYYSQRLRLAASKIAMGEGANKEVIGMEVTGRTIKNKVNRPFLKASWRFMFMKDGTGRFDTERSLVDFLVAEKLLKTGKPGYVIWNEKQVSKEALARDIEKRNAFHELTALLPATYDPPPVTDDAEEAA